MYKYIYYITSVHFTKNYSDQPKRVFVFSVWREMYRYTLYGWLFLENNDSLQCFFFIFFIQFCQDNFTLCVRVRDRHLLKTCFKHFIRVDESWEGLLLVSVQLHCRVKSYQTHISIHAMHTYCHSKLFPVYHSSSYFSKRNLI